MSNLNTILEQIIDLQQRTVIKLTTLDIPTLPENITTQGNNFNGTNQLVKTDSSGKIPTQLINVDDLDFLSEIPADVTRQGNNFNGTSQLVKTNTSGKIPTQLIDVEALDIPTGEIPENITTQGNTFNGPGQLVKTDSTGKIPSTLIVSNAYTKAEIDTKFDDLYNLWEKEY